jgi:hypothetical protein
VKRVASSNPVFSQLKLIFEPGSIPGSSTGKMLVRATSPGQFSFSSVIWDGSTLERHPDRNRTTATNVEVSVPVLEELADYSGVAAGRERRRLSSYMAASARLSKWCGSSGSAASATPIAAVMVSWRSGLIAIGSSSA